MEQYCKYKNGDVVRFKTAMAKGIGYVRGWSFDHYVGDTDYIIEDASGVIYNEENYPFKSFITTEDCLKPFNYKNIKTHE